MRIINGKKPLAVAMSSRSLNVPALTVSDNIVADIYLLSLLIRTHTPEDYLIYIDASIELDLFKKLEVKCKDGYKKDDFLCTDLNEGIDKIITRAEKEIAAARDAELKAQKEQEELLLGKKNYDELLPKYNKLVKEKTKLDSEVARLTKEIEKSTEEFTEEKSKLSNTIEELRNALKSATDKIESMRDDFNAACRKFHINRVNGEWVMLTPEQHE